MPVWLKDLEDQFVAVGEGCFYVIGSPIDALGHPLNITVNLGAASDFATFDLVANIFLIHATQLTKKQVGTYKI